MICTSTSRVTAMRILLVIFAWLQPLDCVLARNITIQDTNPSIVYSPPNSWRSSEKLCLTCLNPHIPTSYHERDGSSFLVDGERENQHLTWLDRILNRRTRSRMTKGGERSMDQDLSLAFNFTGTAIYVFAIQPSSLASYSGPSTNTDISFSLDHRSIGAYHANSSSIVQPETPVFSISSLEPIAHQLVINVGRNSTFLFDRLVYTASPLLKRGEQASTTSESPPKITDSTTQLAQPSPSLDNPPPSKKKRSVTTFAIAVGCVVGVLAFFSAALAFSIIRRRRRSRLRDRIRQGDANPEAAQLHTDASDDSPVMIGPTPFVPRYFPGTVILPQQERFVVQPRLPQRLDDLPSDHPPDYTSAMAEMGTAAPSVSSSNHRHHHTLHSGDNSYADIPPSTPPPPPPPGLDDDNEAHPNIPPPPFPETMDVTDIPRSISRRTSRGSVSPSMGRVVARTRSNRGLNSNNHDPSRPRSRSSGISTHRPASSDGG